MLQLIHDAGWPIWPLIICSILALAFIAERFWTLRKHNFAPNNLLVEVMQATTKGIPGPDVINKLEISSSLGSVLAAGLRALHNNPKSSYEEIITPMENAGRRVAHLMEKHLTAIATIGSTAPLLGLLGTVIGMIEIFGFQGTGISSTGGDPTRLAHGISVALYNTAFGLIVAIPSVICWRYFRALIDDYLLSMELAAERFVRHLNTLNYGVH